MPHGLCRALIVMTASMAASLVAGEAAAPAEPAVAREPRRDERARLDERDAHVLLQTRDRFHAFLEDTKLGRAPHPEVIQVSPSRTSFRGVDVGPPKMTVTWGPYTMMLAIEDVEITACGLVVPLGGDPTPRLDFRVGSMRPSCRRSRSAGPASRGRGDCQWSTPSSTPPSLSTDRDSSTEPVRKVSQGKAARAPRAPPFPSGSLSSPRYVLPDAQGGPLPATPPPPAPPIDAD